MGYTILKTPQYLQRWNAGKLHIIWKEREHGLAWYQKILSWNFLLDKAVAGAAAMFNGGSFHSNDIQMVILEQEASDIFLYFFDVVSAQQLAREDESREHCFIRRGTWQLGPNDDKIRTQNEELSVHKVKKFERCETQWGYRSQALQRAIDAGIWNNKTFAYETTNLRKSWYEGKNEIFHIG